MTFTHYQNHLFIIQHVTVPTGQTNDDFLKGFSNVQSARYKKFAIICYSFFFGFI